jgi:hypothetical protein
VDGWWLGVEGSEETGVGWTVGEWGQEGVIATEYGVSFGNGENVLKLLVMIVAPL